MKMLNVRSLGMVFMPGLGCRPLLHENEAPGIVLIHKKIVAKIAVLFPGGFNNGSQIAPQSSSFPSFAWRATTMNNSLIIPVLSNCPVLDVGSPSEPASLSESHIPASFDGRQDASQISLSCRRRIECRRCRRFR